MASSSTSSSTPDVSRRQRKESVTGGVCVKTENRDDPEINAMALEMKLKLAKIVTKSKQVKSSPRAYINRAGKVVPRVESSVSKSDESIDREDIESIKGRFGWKAIGKYNVPFLIRIIGKERVSFVSVRVAEKQLLSKYLNRLNVNVYKLAPVRSHFTTEAEARLLNDLNQNHTDYMYGKTLFLSGKEYIVHMEDVQEFNAFIEVCYNKLQCIEMPGRENTCGFLKINRKTIVPYCVKDQLKYVPVFYFEGETEELEQTAVKLENWHLAYLKFCCLVQGIRKELYTFDSCAATSLENLKNFYPPDAVFEDFWPPKAAGTNLVTSRNNTHTWISAPSTSAPRSTAGAFGGIFSVQPPLPSNQSAIVPVPPVFVLPTNLPSTPAPSVNVRPSNLSSVPAPPAIVPPSSLPRPLNNTHSFGDWYNNYMRSQQNSMSLQSLVRAGGSVPVSNVALYPNTMVNNIFLSNSQQLRHQPSSSVSQSVNQQFQPQQQHAQNPHQQPVNIPLRGAIYSNNSMAGVPTNALGTRKPIRAALPSQIIDLSSPPSSPTPQHLTQEIVRPPIVNVNNNLNILQIPERSRVGGPNISVYKIHKSTVLGKMIYCINSEPNDHAPTEFMVTLDDVVRTLIPACSVLRCAQILNKVLKTQLYTGNSEQVNLLKVCGRLRSLGNPNQNVWPMVKLRDLTQVVLQLKGLAEGRNFDGISATNWYPITAALQ